MADLQAENKEDNNNQNISQHSKKISISGLKDKTKNCGNLCITSILSAKFLLVAGIAISSAFIIEGLLCFALCSVNVRSYILSLYVHPCSDLCIFYVDRITYIFI